MIKCFLGATKYGEQKNCGGHCPECPPVAVGVATAWL